jgi:thymidylate synthase (FAD)
MKLVKASYTIITPINGEEILKQIELAARTCYKSEGKIEYTCNTNGIPPFTCNSARILIPKLISRGHLAMLEFGGMITVRFIVDRGVSHELVRHRLASFAQESTRYCNYGKDEHISFIIPSWLDIEDNTIIDSITDIFGRKKETYESIKTAWEASMAHSELAYINLIQLGWSPQQARSVLPNSLKTEINMSCNIREWREVFKLRCSNAAHPQMQEVMRPLLAEFQQKIPILFNDINY